MKKAIKGLIVASAVAAVVGVGAVSYAAWAGNTPVKVEESGSTGVIRVLGEMTVTADDDSLADSKLKPLYPVDQGKTAAEGEVQTTLPSGGVTCWGFTVSAPTTTDGGDITYKLKGTLAKGENGTAIGDDTALYWSATKSTDGTLPSTKVLISGDDAAEIASGKGYVYLVADGSDAMQAEITLTFTAE